VNSRILQLSLTFEVEEEERPDLSALCAEIEHRLRSVDGVDEVFSDVAGSTRKYALVVELTGDSPDGQAASIEMLDAIKALVPRLVREPRVVPVWNLDEEEE